MKYKTVKIRATTYKKIKILAAKKEISIIELIDRLYKADASRATTPESKTVK